jgi:hypothetical protein
MARLDWFLIDPLPVPPMVPRDSMAFWRWLSVVMLEARNGK